MSCESGSFLIFASCVLKMNVVDFWSALKSKGEESLWLLPCIQRYLSGHWGAFSQLSSISQRDLKWGFLSLELTRASNHPYLCGHSAEDGPKPLTIWLMDKNHWITLPCSWARWMMNDFKPNTLRFIGKHYTIWAVSPFLGSLRKK